MSASPKRGRRRLKPLALAATLCLALGSAWADEDDSDPIPLTPIPLTPTLPALGSYSKVVVSGAAFRGCADYSMGGIWASDPALPGRRTAVCNDTVYARADDVFTSTTKGERIGAVVSGSSSSNSPNSGFSGSQNGWKNASGAGATATANLQKEGHVLNLKVGAQARNSRDAELSIRPTLDPWSLAQTGWIESGGIGTWWLEDGIYSQSASSLARMADSFVAKGTGTLSMTFTVDGLFGKGSDLPFNAGGGKFSFAVGLFNPNSLVGYDVGGDEGVVRVWQQASFGGFALGRDRRDDPFMQMAFVGPEELLGSSDFFVPESSLVPSGQLTEDPSFHEHSVTVSIPVVDGQTIWLVLGMAAGASGWSECGGTPGDGKYEQCYTIFDPNDPLPSGRTVVDFTSTAKLTSVVFDGGLTGLESASGVDYQLAVATVPIPEPGTYALMALGLAGVMAATRRQSRNQANLG